MTISIFASDQIVLPDAGPLYLRLKRWIEDAVARGDIRPGDALPSERDLAHKVDVSRVTVRKAMQDLVRDGVLVQRHGSGTFVALQTPRVVQSLSHLTSFTEDMAARGMSVTAIWLRRGLFLPSQEEAAALELNPADHVARVERLRLSAGQPLAIERACLAESILPDPEAIGGSLYAHLDGRGMRPVRATQRIRATGLSIDDARLLEVGPGDAALSIERVSHLQSGRVVEFTRSIYRGDAYDFVAELRLAMPGGRTDV